MKPKKPKPVKRLWGIWLPAIGQWQTHDLDGIEGYASKRKAEQWAKWSRSWKGSKWEGCYAAVLCQQENN